MKCSFDPTVYKGAAIGMFHCPECGEMLLAGLPHPDYTIENEEPKMSINELRILIGALVFGAYFLGLYMGYKWGKEK